jgi:pyridinium-3,5-biscarboxylic acid mononucleotide synthase
MNEESIRDMLARVANGAMTPDEATQMLRRLPFEDVGFAKVDHHRALRCGVPEVIFCPAKTPQQVATIAGRILAGGASVLATRASQEQFEAVRQTCPDAEFHDAARCITVRRDAQEGVGCVIVVCAGTSDLPVAEEALVTARMMGADARLIADVGVAGLHRLLAHGAEMLEANVIVAVAGMEGALPSVVAGLVSVPVVAVPTSIGYGASFGGIAALLAMLNSCASGVTVVNIDNGFGAGYAAAMMNRLAVRDPEEKHQ